MKRATRSIAAAFFGRRTAKLILAALCVLPSAVITWQLRDLPHLGDAHDDGIYWVTAQSIAERQEYRIVSLPGEPWQTKYPPLYSAYLSVAWIINPSYPSNLPLAALLMWLWFPVFAAGAWRFFRATGFGEWQSLLLTLLTTALPQSVLMANMLMSDLMFAALLLWCLDQWETSPVTVGVLAGIAYLTRSAGLPLLFAVPIAYLLRRRPNSILLFAVSALPFVAAWHIWCAFHRNPGLDEVTLYYTNYVRYQMQVLSLDRLAERLWTNMGHLVHSISSLLAIDAGDSPPLSLVRPLFAAACISGVIRLFRRGHAVPYALFALIYSAILTAWSFAPDRRFLMPLLPLFLAGAWTEIAHVIKIVRQSWRSARLAAALLVGVLAGLPILFGWNVVSQYQFSGPTRLIAERQRREQLASAYKWARMNVPQEASFFAVNDPVFYLNTGRHALRRADGDIFALGKPGTLRPSDGFVQFARDRGLTHVMFTVNDFEPAIEELNIVADNTGLAVVFRSSAAVILEVSR